MKYTLDFDLAFKYDSKDSGISLPIILKYGEQEVKLNAKIDTGSTFCVFQREYGEELGLDIESGTEEKIALANGSFLATYGHFIQLSTLGIEFEPIVYFAKYYDFSKNVLGRIGWLNQIKLAIIDYENVLYINHYNSD